MKTLVQLLDSFDNEIGLFETDHETIIINDLIEEYAENPLDLSCKDVYLDDFLRSKGYSRVYVEVEYISDDDLVNEF